MKKKFFATSALALSLLFSSMLVITSCQREVNETLGGSNNPGTVDDNIMVRASVMGSVVDENNQPVANATVSSGANTTTTNRYGIFRFDNINLSKANGYVKVDKAGYFLGTRTFVTTTGRTHNVRIKLIPKTNTGNFSAASGGTISLTTGGKLVIPANAITDAGGNAYTGTVNVAMTWINPTSNDLPEIIPGDLRGITTDGQERGLETFGMLGVELTTPGGQALKIATGKTAELTIPVPAAIAGNAPATIDLWHFDETKGRWIQEGTATKTGNTYVGNVSHFSFWNCDAPFPLVNLCMSFVNADNQPLNNVTIRIKRPNGSYGYGRTDSAGNLCGKVPKNELLTLQVLDQCHNVVYSQSIGPFSADATLPAITAIIPGTNSLTITGTVTNCAGANITSGAAVIYIGNGYGYSVPVTNGSFSHTLIRCDATALNFTVLGIDYTNQQQGVPVGGTGTTGTVNVGAIQACGTSATQFVELLIDGIPYNFTAPPDIINSGDSLNTGQYRINAVRTNGAGGGTTSNYFFNLTYNNPSNTTGSFMVTGCWTSLGNLGYGQLINGGTINITAIGAPVTGFIDGNFNVQMNFGNTNKIVQGMFRVRRN